MKQRTDAQNLASRLNGANSKGPATPEGKAISARNAEKHGLTARRVVLENESKEAWDAFLEALSEEWRPESVTEIQIIHDLAAARWRLNRLLDIETALVDLEVSKMHDVMDQFCPATDEVLRIAVAFQALTKDNTLPHIHRHETSLRRIVNKSMAQLLAIQAARIALSTEQPQIQLQNEPDRQPEAPRQPQAPNMQNEPGQPVLERPVTPLLVLPSPSSAPKHGQQRRQGSQKRRQSDPKAA